MKKPNDILDVDSLKDKAKKGKTIGIVESLRADSKKGEDYFDCNASVVTYKTGFPQLDYYLGYLINVYDDDNQIIDSYPSLGITAGSMVTFIGKPSTAKTTTAAQVAANIVRDFDNGFIVHFDLEQAMNYTRIMNLTRFKMTDLRAGKYILRQELNTINDIKATIMKIYNKKVENPDIYRYNTGKKNEFGEDIILFQPTVIILDSIATLSSGIDDGSKKSLEKLEEVGSQSEKLRATGEISRFFNEILPFLRRANIILITINQIKDKPQLGFVHDASEILYLSPTESLPGGKAPQFNASVLLKFIAIGSEKATYEEDGYDGFGIRVMIIKSRGNQAGRFVNLVYDKVRGIDPLRSSVRYAKDLGLTGGNKNKFYFNSNKDDFFSLKDIHSEFKTNKNLYSIMFGNIVPELKSKLSMLTESDLEIDEEEMAYDY